MTDKFLSLSPWWFIVFAHPQVGVLAEVEHQEEDSAQVLTMIKHN